MVSPYGNKRVNMVALHAARSVFLLSTDTVSMKHSLWKHPSNLLVVCPDEVLGKLSRTHGTAITVSHCMKRTTISLRSSHHLVNGDRPGPSKVFCPQATATIAVLMQFCRIFCARRGVLIDDTIFYDENLEEHWWRPTESLTLVGRAGIVLNRDKFQFAQSAVDFAGFRISQSLVEPLPKYLHTIKGFPTPANITDIRSCFGLVNQVAHYAQLRDLMAPFKPLLSLMRKFEWTDELNQAFAASKSAIVDSIRHGLEIFDPSRRTCLRPDWSNKGIAYFLL